MITFVTAEEAKRHGAALRIADRRGTVIVLGGAERLYAPTCRR